MKTILVLPLILIVLFTCGCNGNESLIKKDLNSRFVKYEIVEIREDSSNVFDAKMTLLSLKINISKGESDITEATNFFYDYKWSLNKTSAYIKSISSNLMEMYMDFMALRYSKIEPCYYVKYLVYRDELKVEREDYYYIRTYNDGVESELIHRPCDWETFLIEEGCENLFDECCGKYMAFLYGVLY